MMAYAGGGVVMGDVLYAGLPICKAEAYLPYDFSYFFLFCWPPFPFLEIWSSVVEPYSWEVRV